MGKNFQNIFCQNKGTVSTKIDDLYVCSERTPATIRSKPKTVTRIGFSY